MKRPHRRPCDHSHSKKLQHRTTNRCAVEGGPLEIERKSDNADSFRTARSMRPSPQLSVRRIELGGWAGVRRTSVSKCSVAAGSESGGNLDRREKEKGHRSVPAGMNALPHVDRRISRIGPTRLRAISQPAAKTWHPRATRICNHATLRTEVQRPSFEMNDNIVRRCQT